MIEEELRSSGVKWIAGVDEAGRGACAGPLVVAAVILKEPKAIELSGVADSKTLTERERENLFTLILERAEAHAIVTIPPEEIDELGLHKCNIEGMRRAVNGLKVKPDYVLTDGYQIPGIPIPNLAIWKGDQVALSISAASIIAKVHRDRIMSQLDSQYPAYGLARHKGYVTRAHSQALVEHGVSIIHRKSYANIAKLLKN